MFQKSLFFSYLFLRSLTLFQLAVGYVGIVASVLSVVFFFTIETLCFICLPGN